MTKERWTDNPTIKEIEDNIQRIKEHLLGVQARWERYPFSKRLVYHC